MHAYFDAPSASAYGTKRTSQSQLESGAAALSARVLTIFRSVIMGLSNRGPNRTAELGNGEFGTHRAPPFSKVRSLRLLVPYLVGLTRRYSATIAESKIYLQKQ